MLGFISAVPVRVSIYGEVQETAEINFFVLHTDARGKRSGNTNLARVIITEITRRCYKSGIRLALYTGAQEMPHAMSRTAYFHRKLNVPKLVSTGFSSLPDGMSLEQLSAEFAVSSELRLAPGHQLRKFGEDAGDAAACHRLLGTYYNKHMELYREMNVAEVSHVLSNKERVIYSWVITNEAGDVTDLASFYSLPSSILDTDTDTKVGTLENAYLWYTVATSIPRATLIQNVLMLAKQEGFDAFTALGIAGLPDDLLSNKFVKGTGTLRRERARERERLRLFFACARSGVSLLSFTHSRFSLSRFSL